jgi:hypothetical protein
MKRLIFTLCAIVAVTGCAPTTPDPDPVPALLAKFEAEGAVRDSMMAEGRGKIRACQDAVNRLRIGTGVKEALALPCKPDRINVTETASGRRDQWVYSEYHNGFSSYLYFTNGVLVAKQVD